MKKSTRKHLLSLLTGIALFTSLDKAHAATATTTMQVTVNVTGHCTIAATTFAFPDYDGTGVSPIVQTPQNPITVTCPNLQPYTIAASTGTSGSFINRTMRNGANAINYNLYTDNGYANVWNTTTNLINGAGTGAAQTPTVYGQMAANQLQTNTGAYADTLTLTLTW